MWMALPTHTLRTKCKNTDPLRPKQSLHKGEYRRRNSKKCNLTYVSHKSIIEDDLRYDIDDSSRCASLAPSPQFCKKMEFNVERDDFTPRNEEKN